MERREAVSVKMVGTILLRAVTSSGLEGTDLYCQYRYGMVRSDCFPT